MSENNTSTPNTGAQASEASTESSTENLESQESSQELSQEEGQEEGSEESKEEKKESKKAPETKSSRKKLKLKVDGKEFEEEVDLENEEYLTQQMQLAKAAKKRMAEYAQLEKDVKEFVEQLKKDPRAILSNPNLGIDLKQLAAQIIDEEMENSKKSPEQLEKERLESELKRLQEESKKKDEDFKKREFERLQQQEYERYDFLMDKALEKASIPKNSYTIKKMADYMLLGLENGIDVHPDDVISLVQAEMHEDLKNMFSVMPDEVIEQLIGKEKISSLRKKAVSKAKEKPPVPVKDSVRDVAGGDGKKEKAESKQSFKQFFGV